MTVTMMGLCLAALCVCTVCAVLYLKFREII